MNAVVKSYHTHAGGESEGWFGAGWIPVLSDSAGRPVMGTEWKVVVDKTLTLDEAAKIIDFKVVQEVDRRVQEADEVCRYVSEDPETHVKTACTIKVPIVVIDGYFPTIIHEPKSGQHRLIYPPRV